MLTSEFSCIQEAITKAIEASQAEDRIVSLWIDDTTIDDALDTLKIIESDAPTNSDHELVEDNHVDAWGDDWRIVIRVQN